MGRAADPLQRQKPTGRGQRAPSPTGIYIGQKASLAQPARFGDAVQDRPELRLQRDGGGMAGQKDRSFGQASHEAQRADFSTMSAEAGAPFVRTAWRVSVTKTSRPEGSRISARAA
jgi:hypothetical protein